MTSQLPDIIPIVIITGFLGAGKTTLLNSLLSDSRFRDRLLLSTSSATFLDHDLVRIGSRDLMVTTTG
jgi:predicted AAA+ superfamily ATPase